MRIAGARRATASTEIDRLWQGSEVDERTLLYELLEFVSTEVKELGSEKEMAHIERIIREGTGADRQLSAWESTQNIKAVVDHIVAETYEGLVLPP
jgi:Uncharacterized conserved protein